MCYHVDVPRLNFKDISSQHAHTCYVINLLCNGNVSSVITWQFYFFSTLRSECQHIHQDTVYSRVTQATFPSLDVNYCHVYPMQKYNARKSSTD
jgi:hypothetical protein